MHSAFQTSQRYVEKLCLQKRGVKAQCLNLQEVILKVAQGVSGNLSTLSGPSGFQRGGLLPRDTSVCVRVYKCGDEDLLPQDKMDYGVLTADWVSAGEKPV